MRPHDLLRIKVRIVVEKLAHFTVITNEDKLSRASAIVHLHFGPAQTTNRLF